MTKELEALGRLKTINLDIVLKELGYDKACDVSVYGIHDFPTLEMSGDLQTLEEALTPPTEDEVCKAIEQEKGLKVIYNLELKEFVWKRYPEIVCGICDGNLVILYNFTPHTTALIGKFYEKEAEK